MKDIPSLFSLCLKAVTWNIMHGCGYSQDLFELPSVFLDGLFMILPPLALENIYELSIGSSCKTISTVNSISTKRKRGRLDEKYSELNVAWETLYRKRWPENLKMKHQLRGTEASVSHGSACATDWQQLYWEEHLQDCLDAVTEQALLPSFDGNIAELEIPDNIMGLIGHFGSEDCKCSKLSCHCKKFGCYVRCLRLQSVLCRDEVFDLLGESKLEVLILRRILSRTHVDGACRLIYQNRETLVSIELVYCKLLPLDIDMICNSIYSKDIRYHGIQHFSIKSSNIFGSKSSSIPSGLSFFLSSGRSLHSVHFADVHMGQKSAEGIFKALIESSSCLASFEMSGNELEGWLSKVGNRYNNFSPVSEPQIALQSLVLLNLRGNNLNESDISGLHHLLDNMPNLLSLDLSDNPIGDDGVRSLVPFFVKALGKTSCATEIWLENCDLSGIGVSELLQTLTMINGQLKTLSFAGNNLGSSIAPPLAKFLGTSRIRNLNIEDIGLGSFGFKELDREMAKETDLVHINISKNRGGIQAAHFICRIISRAPDIVSINGGSNLLPPESLPIIEDALRKSKGNKLEKIDLTGNTSLCSVNSELIISQFMFQGNPIINLSSFDPYLAPHHDDDP